MNRDEQRIEEAEQKTGVLFILFLLFMVIAYNTMWDINNPPSIQEGITVISIVFGLPYVIFYALKDPHKRAVVATYSPKVALGLAKMFYYLLKASYLLVKFTFRLSKSLIHAVEQRRRAR